MNKEKKMKLELNNTINTNQKSIKNITRIMNSYLKKKERNSGIELMRIIGMYSILIGHIIGHSNLLKKYKNYRGLKLHHISCYWHINSFALISGIIGYKGYKYSNLLYLWISVVFYSSIIYFFFKFYYIIDLNLIVILKIYFFQ